MPGFSSNLEGWQLRELGVAAAGASGLTLRSEGHAVALASTNGSDSYESAKNRLSMQIVQISSIRIR
ncbi:hypothetical protein [Paenibacillus abyssi]|uniref:hypothetical protein n=1 Tax=Paenibacillus abyssi TaxID=1340531 RepID=UPI00166B827B|nr:hypothetical protein [Paenibacillus abyssi]